MIRRTTPFSIVEASQASPTLSRLMDQSRESNEMLLSIENLIPPTLKSVVLAGPVDGTSWCLIVEGSAAVAKLRQLLPKFQAQLLSRGKHITDIRLKVKSRTRY